MEHATEVILNYLNLVTGLMLLPWTFGQVLPHERQAVRESKKSISAREVLSAEVWSETLRTNAFDLLLFHWAKRVYLERSACRAHPDW